MTKKQIGIKITLGAVALVLIAVIVVANVMLNKYSFILNQFFAGDTTDYSDAGEQLEEGDAVVQALAEDSMVLLKNDDFLPLSDTENVNLFGWAATDQGFLLVGGGSGGTVIAEENKVTLTDAFEQERLEYNTELLAAYSAISSTDADKNSNSPDSIAALANPDSSFYTSERMTEAKNYSSTAVVVLSRFSGENASQTELLSVGSYTDGTFLELTENERAMFDALEEYGFDVVVLFNTCNNMEMGFLEEYDCIKAALYVGVPGQSGTLAIPRILRGDVNPSGRTADTLAYDYQTNNPTYANAMYVNNSMVYQEGIYVGYKWYETADVEGFFEGVSNSYGTGYDGVVQYPFGYGLSYTTFEWTVESVSWTVQDDMAKDVTYTVKVSVKNTGDVAGKDVVQLYCTPPYKEGGVEMASVNLIDFVKTDTLQPGESKTYTLSFTAYDLASYDAYGDYQGDHTGYLTVEGDYALKLMRNAHEAGPMASGSDSVYNLYSAGLSFETDPDTGAKVENRFTGEDAYADCPIDGSTAIPGGVDYLSRANDFANYPTSRAASADTSVTGAASSYTYDGYDNMDISNIKYGEDAGMYLVQVENEDGTYSRATLAMLEGTEEANLVINEELMETLSDYEAEEWDAFLNQMTQTEIKDLIGKGGFQTVAVYSVGKPYCVDRDGPAGFNMGVTNTNTETKWTGFPTESLIGCSWNKELAYQMGVTQGQVAEATGLQGWYAPGVNLHRSVYNTRNYEYYSEDAVLSGKLASETVRGAKENNLYCYVKHFAVSEAGANPNDKNTWLTEQALREIYLKPFEMTVKEGGANAMMSAFNRVGAVWAGANYALLTEVLRGEWGFDGSVITDWFQPSYMDYTKGVKAGNNLWLDGTFSQAANLDLNDTGTAYAARLSAKNILYTYLVTITAVSVTAAPQSALFSALWITLNVVLALGTAACIFFAVKPPKKIAAESGEAD